MAGDKQNCNKKFIVWVKKLAIMGLLVFGIMLLGDGKLVAVKAAMLCDIETKDLDVCRAAVTPVNGRSLPLPTETCCGIVRRADLNCLCNLKSLLPALGINTANAMALLPKCGLIQTPSQCHGP